MSYLHTLKAQAAALLCNVFGIEPEVVVQEVTKTIIEPVGADKRFKPFFIHEVFFYPGDNGKHSQRRGMTLYVQPGDTWREIKVQHAFCSMKDCFSKKAGRAAALESELVVMNARELPMFLSELHHQALGDGGDAARFTTHRYNRYLKYVL